MNQERRMLLASLLYVGSGLPALANLIRPANASLATLLADEKNNYALLYFVQQGCQYCARQAPILADFQRLTGWYIKQVDIQLQPEVRTKFNISNTPTIVLVKRNSDARSWQPVSYGFSPSDTLWNSIYGITRVLNGQADPRLLQALLNQGQSTPFAGGQ